MSAPEIIVKSLLVGAACFGAAALARGRWREGIAIGAGVLLFLLPLASLLPIWKVDLPALPGAVSGETSGFSQALSFMARGVLLVWLAGSLLVLGRMILARRALSRILQRSEAAPVWQSEDLVELGTGFGLRRLPRLRVLPGAMGPAVVGLLKPVFLLPASASGWDRDRWQAVACHELAHLRRRDLWRDAFFSMLLVLYWWNPSVWALRRIHRREREYSCDAAVIAGGCQPTDYARHLLDLATAPTAALAMADGDRGSLETRIGRLLAPPPENSGSSLLPGLLLVVGLAFAVASFVVQSVPAGGTLPSAEIALRLGADPFPAD